MKNLKRATEKLRAAGIADIVIRRRVWGYSPVNPNFGQQKTICFKTEADAVAAVIAGFRPIDTWAKESTQ